MHDLQEELLGGHGGRTLSSTTPHTVMCYTGAYHTPTNQLSAGCKQVEPAGVAGKRYVAGRRALSTYRTASHGAVTRDTGTQDWTSSRGLAYMIQAYRIL